MRNCECGVDKNEYKYSWIYKLSSKKRGRGGRMSNIMDIHIYDLQGNEYDINNINIRGNDDMEIIIKKPNEEYKPLSTTFEKVNELINQRINQSSIKEICNALERAYGKEEKNCKYHFKIEEYGSCYTLDKIVFNDKFSSIATIWFNDMVSDSNMLSKEKAYELIQNIKKYLEEVEE